MVISTADQRGVSVEAPELAARVTITQAVFKIIVALADGELHGYGIMQDVDRVTNGETNIGPGTLYRSIQRMVVDGLIEELDIALDGEGDDDRRRYYRLTEKGRAVATAE